MVKEDKVVKKVKKLSIFDCTVVIFLLLFALIFLYPLWTIFVAAFSDPLEYVKDPLALFPKTLTFYNFRMLVTSSSVWMGYQNTILYVGVGTAINVVMTFLTAYALSQQALPWRRTFNFLIVLTLFFSGGLIPTYLTVKAYGMLNSILSLIHI